MFNHQTPGQLILLQRGNMSFCVFTSQVIKVAAIVGFGVLVLLTRQKEPRYGFSKQLLEHTQTKFVFNSIMFSRRNHKEDRDNDNLFHIPDYVD